MKTWTKIVLSLSCLLIVGYALVATRHAQRHQPVTQCTGLTICIRDSAQREYVSTGELTQLLRNAGLYPVGRELDQINLQAMEQTIGAHSMVRRVDCFTTSKGMVRINLTQRIPLYRVQSSDGEYIVDTDHRKMPARECIRTPMLRATRHIGERMAREELAELVEWIYKRRYWRERITRIHVAGPKMVHLYLRDYPGVVILGDLDGYTHKLDKLNTFLHEQKKQELPAYKEIDIRYHGQVIGRK